MNCMRKVVVGSRRVSLATTVPLLVLLCSWPSVLLSQSSATTKRAPIRKTSPVRGSAGSFASSVQAARNLGVAYYEQGKYPEAAGQFKKVVAAGHAVALDHMNLALALMQDNKLNEALGELATTQQMAPKLISVEYNLGILYKRELRYTDAEAALKGVVAADPDEPSAWFNLGVVYFLERKFPEALEAHERVNKMGFGRGQNFYVASLFRTFTVLNRLGQREEAQKVLALHGGDDPHVPPKDVAAFEDEMRAGGVDWQLVVYGGAVHSFTNPAAGSDKSRGAAYDANADHRSWQAMQDFFRELFAE